MRTLAALAAAWTGALTAAARAEELAWGTPPPLPPAAGRTEQPGVAGPFVGVHRGALLVGGGANFPEKMPWDGGAKVWWDDLRVLEEAGTAEARWAPERFALPRRIGYGYTFSVADGVVCVGGHDAERVYAEAFLLAWDPAARTVRRTELLALPRPLTFMAGAQVGTTLFVFGGQHGMSGDAAAPTRTVWSLDLEARGRGAAWRWEERPAWPGPERVLPVAVAQRGPAGREEIFLFSGRRPRAGAATELLRDAYAFDPAANAWRALGPVGGGAGVCVMGATAVAAGDREVLVLGGDRGELFLELEAHDRAIAALRARGGAAAEAEIATRLAAKRAIYARHPDFAREVLAYDARADRWRLAGRAPEPLPVTTQAVAVAGGALLPSGEVKPGVRTPAVRSVRWRER